MAANAGAYFYPWAQSRRVTVAQPREIFAAHRCDGARDWLRRFDKLILINGMEDWWLFQPAYAVVKQVFFFLWDPARCPRYAPAPQTLARLKCCYKVYSFQQEDCANFGLRFNSTMYAPPPRGFLPQNAAPLCDVLFLGVPKDRLPQLRRLHAALTARNLRTCFRVGLTGYDDLPEEHAPGWLVTREWVDYPKYLQWVARSRALLDLYQSIQTGFSLRVMEHIFFEKKLITNNRAIRRPYGGAPAFYHPDNIFILGDDNINDLPAWLNRPFVSVPARAKEYFRFENWVGRFG